MQLQKLQWLNTTKVISCSRYVCIAGQLLFSLTQANSNHDLKHCQLPGQRVNSEAKRVLSLNAFP